MHMPTNSATFTARINENIHTFERKRERGVYRLLIINKALKSEHFTSNTRIYALVSLK